MRVPACRADVGHHDGIDGDGDWIAGQPELALKGDDRKISKRRRRNHSTDGGRGRWRLIRRDTAITPVVGTMKEELPTAESSSGSWSAIVTSQQI